MRGLGRICVGSVAAIERGRITENQIGVEGR